MHTSHKNPTSRLQPAVERRSRDRSKPSLPDWVGERAGSPKEIAALEELFNGIARQMGQLRSQNQKLMVVNSDLRCRLGEVTLQWVDACGRVPQSHSGNDGE